jgi:hypothetical protein
MAREEFLTTTLVWHRRQVEKHVVDAYHSLENGDFSAAATACHRAHQSRLVADVVNNALKEEL